MGHKSSKGPLNALSSQQNTAKTSALPAFVSLRDEHGKIPKPPSCETREDIKRLNWKSQLKMGQQNYFTKHNQYDMNRIYDEYDDSEDVGGLLAQLIVHPQFTHHGYSEMSIVARIIRLYLNTLIISEIIVDSNDTFYGSFLGQKISIAVHPFTGEIYISDETRIFHYNNLSKCLDIVACVPLVQSDEDDNYSLQNSEEDEQKYEENNSNNNNNNNNSNNNNIKEIDKNKNKKNNKIINIKKKKKRKKNDKNKNTSECLTLESFTHQITDLCWNNSGTHLLALLNNDMNKVYYVDMEHSKLINTHYIYDLHNVAKYQWNKWHDSRTLYELKNFYKLPILPSEHYRGSARLYLNVYKNQLWFTDQDQVRNGPIKYVYLNVYCVDLDKLFNPETDTNANKNADTNADTNGNINKHEMNEMQTNQLLDDNKASSDNNNDDNNNNNNNNAKSSSGNTPKKVTERKCPNFEVKFAAHLQMEKEDLEYRVNGFAVDKFYDGVYLLLENYVFYRFEPQSPQVSNLVSEKKETDNEENSENIKKIEEDISDLKTESKESSEPLKEQKVWTRTHRVCLREILKDKGGIPLGFCTVIFDSVSGRILIADNFKIRGIYI